MTVKDQISQALKIPDGLEVDEIQGSSGAAGMTYVITTRRPPLTLDGEFEAVTEISILDLIDNWIETHDRK